ncbi:hypothetical protein BDW42DRAFT_176748 [Aspergillus taichungensis]|uniref:Uncharacterized protein n=1 Tax=Aspergillus taichungensis TaxID=482145 RepID=A0A2J5HK89_9EURO|nr:hypothetical protein BDW42DRAFT_176748 [Aspergillus taichungensis]
MCKALECSMMRKFGSAADGGYVRRQIRAGYCYSITTMTRTRLALGKVVPMLPREPLSLPPDGQIVLRTILQVQPLSSTEDGLAILQTRYQRENVKSDPHAIRLAERFEGLPLAIATAGAYLRKSSLTVEHYLQAYSNTRFSPCGSRWFHSGFDQGSSGRMKAPNEAGHTIRRPPRYLGRARVSTDCLGNMSNDNSAMERF